MKTAPIIFWFLCTVCAVTTEAQTDTAAVNRFSEVWPANIKPRLEKQPATDTSFFFMIKDMREICREDYECLKVVYKKLSDSTEILFNLPAAVYVTQELIAVSNQAADIPTEAEAYLDLHRFYMAMNMQDAATQSGEKSLELFALTDEVFMPIVLKMYMLEDLLQFRTYRESESELNALFAEAKAIPKAVRFLHYRAVSMALATEDYEAMEKHVSALEVLHKTGELEKPFYKTALIGRAEINILQNNLSAAEDNYREVLDISLEISDRWHEVNALVSLAGIKYKQKSVSSAKSYLQRAQNTAEKLALDDHLSKIYALQTEIAEAEGRYATALDFYRKQITQEEKRRKKTEGFQMQNYHLQLSNEKLAAEKERQKLTLTFQENRLRNLYIISALAALLLGLLIFGYTVQRRRKKELAAQNRLILQQKEKLENADAAKSRFFANVSHELRTPLSLILGPLDSVLKSGTLDDRNHRFLQTAQDSGKQLLHLVSSILDLSKSESGKLKTETETVHFYPFIRRICAAFESYARQGGLDFIFEYQAEKSLHLKLDCKKCETVFNNLLSNAVKFTPAGGRITLHAEDAGNKIIVTVVDTGRGIHLDDLPHIFDRYYQSEQPDAPTEGGTGIGLSLIRNLLQIMGGAVQVQSRPGEGSTFIVELPRREVIGTQSNARQEMRDENRGQPIPVSRNTAPDLPLIMVTEDNQSLREYLETLLSPYYRVITAIHGQDALDKLSAGPELPALLLSDVMMPVTDGFKFLEEVKSSPAYGHLPFVMLTARADRQDKLKALRIGVDDYLLKPFEEEELLVRIKNLLLNQKGKPSPTEKGVSSDSVRISQSERAWLEKFEEHISHNLDSSLLSVSNLAVEFAMSESSLLRRLKKLTGLTPIKYIQEIRLAQAKTYLENKTFDSIAATARAVGYSDVRSFSRTYKKRFGKSPSEV